MKNKEKIKARNKLKNTKNSIIRKRKEPQDLLSSLKVIRQKLKPFTKAYINFREKRKTKKQKEEFKKLREQEKQRLQEQEQQKIREQEEKRIKKIKKIKEEEQKKIKIQEERRLKEKKLKEVQKEKERQDRIYKERLVKAEQERLDQLKRVNKLREEEKELIEERKLKIQNSIAAEQKLKEEKRLDEKHEKKRINGKVKWFNHAKGYGFINREDEKKDIFVHFSAVQNAGLKSLKAGEQITFEVQHTDKGSSAINLQKIVNKISRSYLKVIK